MKLLRRLRRPDKPPGRPFTSVDHERCGCTVVIRGRHERTGKIHIDDVDWTLCPTHHHDAETPQ